MSHLSTLTSTFSEPLLDWFDQHGRKDLPWKHPAHNPYRIWISEIMLQQTQVKSVIPYFERFIARFPSLEQLALASEEDVLVVWSGLGYYSRARNLHRTAQIIWHDHQGVWPQEQTLLSTLPGIGPSTAAAITAQAFHQATPILDANVKRVLSRYFMVDGIISQTSVLKHLWQLAAACMPQQRCADYTQAIMDLGATCCTNNKPQCTICPLKEHCKAVTHRCVEQYPKKNKRNPIPTRMQQFLFISHQSAGIYLEKRASLGIWGGLWCFPAFESVMEIPNYLQKKFQIILDSDELLEPFMEVKHSFTHFHLKMQVWQIIDSKSVEFIQSLPVPGSWFDKKSIYTIGLPRPVQKIIQKYFEKQNT